MITVQTPKKNVVDDETVMGMYPDPNSETNANKSALAVVQAQSALPREAVVTAWLLRGARRDNQRKAVHCRSKAIREVLAK